MSYLYEKIGYPKSLLNSVAYTSDGIADTAATGTAVPTSGASSILFLMDVGVTNPGTLTMSLLYSTSGSASDASGSTTVWASSDATFAAITSDSTVGIKMLELDISKKSIGQGYLHPHLVVGAAAVGVVSLIAIPNPATATLPLVPATDVVVADGTGA